MWFPLNFVVTWIIKILIILMLNMLSHFKFMYNLEKM